MQLVRASDTKHALGGPASIHLISEKNETELEALLGTLWREIFYFEKKFSRFLPSSELTRFNKKAGTKVPISPAMHDVLSAAKHYADVTNDLYNPFILPALQRAGYKNSAADGYTADPAPDYTDRHVVKSVELQIGKNWALIPHGSAIDLGGMGKGYLLDRLTQLLKAESLHGYWVELSGDIITYGYDETNSPIAVGIQNARDITQSRTDVHAVGTGGTMAVATSGTFKRDAHDSSQFTHHIIDPRSGSPAQTDVLLATVCAPSALAADIAASCAVIEGTQGAAAILRKLGCEAWMIQYTTSSGSVSDIVQGPLIQELSK